MGPLKDGREKNGLHVMGVESGAEGCVLQAMFEAQFSWEPPPFDQRKWFSVCISR